MIFIQNITDTISIVIIIGILRSLRRYWNHWESSLRRWISLRLIFMMPFHSFLMEPKHQNQRFMFSLILILQILIFLGYLLFLLIYYMDLEFMRTLIISNSQKEQLSSHWYFIRLYPRKKGTFKFCLPSLLEFHMDSKQKD